MHAFNRETMYAAVRELPDGRRLHLLNLLLRDSLEEQHAATQRRLNMHRRITECDEGGMVALIESGMDCDGVRYAGRVHLVPATWQAVVAREDEIYKWADGPCNLYIERPSVADEVEYQSRDLALEAFEDGHPYSLYA